MTTTSAADKTSYPLDRSARGILALLAMLLSGVLALTIAACAPPSDDSDASEASEASDVSVEIPSTPVGKQARWVLDEVNGESLGSEEELAERFDASIFEDVTAAELRTALEGLWAARPWEPTAYEGDDEQAKVAITSSEVTYDMSVSVAENGLMNGLFFGLPQPDRAPSASWDELRTALEDAPYEVALQVRELGAGEPEVLIGDAEAAPIGSVFKLYVLGAVADAIDTGSLTWDTPLTIDGEVRSLPSGELQDLPDGSTVTVLEAAQQMIAISDNTAADALIRAVGRDAVVAALADMGQSAPELNTPFFTTREFFWVGWGEVGLREKWADADASERATILGEVPAGVPDIASMDMTAPAWQSGVDWFATPDDIARAHFALQERAATETLAPVRDILSANPGIALGEEWTYVGFKGGSAPGVLAGSWYLERDGADPAVLSLLARSDDARALADPAAVFGYAQDAAALLAQE